jgi:probable HAF family extracellular repeat protein
VVVSTHGVAAVITCCGLALAGLAGASSGAEAGSTARWTIHDLGTLGGKESAALDVNNRGQIVGWAETGRKAGGIPVKHAVLWQQGKRIDLGVKYLPGRSSMASKINDRGDIVLATDFDGSFLLRGGKLVKLRLTEVYALNERGQVIGIGFAGNGSLHGFLWESGKPTDLGSLEQRRRAAWEESAPTALNERGQIVGYSPTDARDRDDDSITWGFLWQEGRMIALPPLRGPRDSVYPAESHASSINARGHVVGHSDTRREQEGSRFLAPGLHAVLWVRGRVVDLGTLATSRYDRRVNSAAVAINDRRWIIGYSEPSADKPAHATLWRAGTIFDLHPRGNSSEAEALNERGQIVMTVGLARGTRSFVWHDGRATDLGTLPGGQTSIAADLNEDGLIVGISSKERNAKGTCRYPGEEQRRACMRAVVWRTR